MKKLIPFLLGRYLNFMSYVYPTHAASTGFRIFCYPFRAAMKPHQQQFLATAEQSTLNHKGTLIKIFKWNDGPKKVLFLHGWQSHSFRWKNYVENFPADEYTIYALDAPGHGLSSGNFLTVPLYSQVVEKFIIDNGPIEAVISHSLGSFTILYTLFRLPLLPVSRLVLLAPPGEATEFIDFYQKSLGLSNRAIDGIVRHFEDVIMEPVEFFSAPKFASTINRAGLIIHDEEDDETSFNHSIAIHKAWKKSELMITKGLSHNLKSPEIVKKVSSFVREERTETEMAYSEN
jgi:pimeloyl-ACP methyl ester carboxylesterase